MDDKISIRKDLIFDNTATLTRFVDQGSTKYNIDELEKSLSFELTSAVPEEATHVCCYGSQVFSKIGKCHFQPQPSLLMQAHSTKCNNDELEKSLSFDVNSAILKKATQFVVMVVKSSLKLENAFSIHHHLVLCIVCFLEV